MLLNIVILFCLIFKCYAQFEGESCTKDSQTGTCTILSQCPTAVEDIKQRRNPQICGFNGADPIVCCFDNEPQNVTPSLQIATTTSNPTHLTTPAFEPPDYEYVDPGSEYPGCADMPVGWTTAKTGQIAFDKCIEYHQKYVYPCERSVTFSDDMVRGYHCRHDTEDLITHSLEVSKHEFSHAVSVGYGETLDEVQWLCSGNIISENFILTSGHCIKSRDYGNASFVVVGVVTPEDLMNRDNTFKVKRVIKHPNYKPPIFYNDIALLEVEKPIPLSQFLVPACLDVGGPVNDSSVLAVSWAVNPKIYKMADRLQKVILQKHPVKVCSDFHTPERRAVLGFDPQLQTCYAARTPGRDMCQGDGGGGILVKSKTVHCMYTIMGITSYGKRCGDVSIPAIYTRVVAYVPWIESIVWP